jgi:hypothetical protein
MCEKKEQDTLGQIRKQTDSKGIKYNPSFEQNEGLERRWMRNTNRIPHNKLPRITK